MASKELFKIFIIEDDDWFRQFLNHLIALNPDYEVTAFANAKEFLLHIHEQPHIVTLDYSLPDMDGAKLLQRIKDSNPEIEVIVISEQEKIETALQLLKAGAYDYLVKSKQINDSLLNSIRNCIKQLELKSRVAVLEKQLDSKYEFEKYMIGKSDAMKTVFELISKAVKNNIVVSITGETGTGKEMVANAIHFNSPFKKGKFVPINMAAIPAELAESELFGHEKGAFTGAVNSRIGKFEEADGGTIFLDEITEMDVSLQAKLLRVLQEKEVIRVGSNKPIPVNCRIIVASNRNMLEEVKKGNFREDLYYRVFGLPIKLPPLRERDNDVLILATFFIDKFCSENKIKSKKLSREAQQKLVSYKFPGNVRELKSIVELAVVLSNSEIIQDGDISLTEADLMTDLISEELTLDEFNDKIIRHFLKKYDDNVLKVAEKLKIGKSTIYRLLKAGK